MYTKHVLVAHYLVEKIVVIRAVQRLRKWVRIVVGRVNFSDFDHIIGDMFTNKMI